jgi:hypothetical protein
MMIHCSAEFANYYFSNVDSSITAQVFSSLTIGFIFISLLSFPPLGTSQLLLKIIVASLYSSLIASGFKITAITLFSQIFITKSIGSIFLLIIPRSFSHVT